MKKIFENIKIDINKDGKESPLYEIVDNIQLLCTIKKGRPKLAGRPIRPGRRRPKPVSKKRHNR